MKTKQAWIIFGLTLGFSLSVEAQYSGVINDPDGYVNVRKGQDAKSAVVTKVNKGEVFEFEESEGSPWWKVTTSTGKTGWVYYDRIRFQVSADDLSDGGEGDELTLYGKAKGVDYYKLAKKAATGDKTSLEQYLALDDTDGAAGEMHAHIFNTVIHLLGDERLATFLKSQPLQIQTNVRNQWMNELALWPFEPAGYVQRNFPLSAKILLKKSVTSWESPNGNYAIHKKFSDESASENTTVEVAQIIDLNTKGVLNDFSEDDLGAGLSREGSAMWADDSSAVAVFTGSLYQAGEVLVFSKGPGVLFSKVALPIRSAHEHEGADDKELKGAELIFSRIEPLKWNENTLTVQRHDYYEKTTSDGTIDGIGKTFLWEIEIKDGKSRTVSVKPFVYEE